MIELLSTFAACFAVGVSLGRLAVCNERCCEQRKAIAAFCHWLTSFDRERGHRAWELYASVSYGRHLASLFFGRYPVELYRATERRIGQ